MVGRRFLLFPATALEDSRSRSRNVKPSIASAARVSCLRNKLKAAKRGLMRLDCTESCFISFLVFWPQLRRRAVLMAQRVQLTPVCKIGVGCGLRRVVVRTWLAVH